MYTSRRNSPREDLHPRFKARGLEEEHDAYSLVPWTIFTLVTDQRIRSLRIQPVLGNPRPCEIACEGIRLPETAQTDHRLVDSIKRESSASPSSPPILSLLRVGRTSRTFIRPPRPTSERQTPNLNQIFDFPARAEISAPTSRPTPLTSKRRQLPRGYVITPLLVRKRPRLPSRKHLEHLEAGAQPLCGAPKRSDRMPKCPKFSFPFASSSLLPHKRSLRSA